MVTSIQGCLPSQRVPKPISRTCKCKCHRLSRSGHVPRPAAPIASETGLYFHSSSVGSYLSPFESARTGPEISSVEQTRSAQRDGRDRLSRTDGISSASAELAQKTLQDPADTTRKPRSRPQRTELTGPGPK